MIEIIKGDITKLNFQYIAHQCNSIHNRNFGLASAISKTYSYANIYSGKYAISQRTPGDIIIRGSKDEQKVIALIAQIKQGKPDKKDSNDTKEEREKLFEKCLEKIANIDGIYEIAFPYGIGCGFAGGDWDKYYEILLKFSEKYSIEVKLIQI